MPRADSNTVYLAVFLHAPSAAWHIKVEVFERGHEVTQMEVETPVATAQFLLHIPYAKLWYPHAPNLYDLRIRLYDDEKTLVDEVVSYFGIRGIELRDGHIRINGDPIYLKMVLDQGYFPGGYLTAASDEALQTDIGWTKLFGFNGARKRLGLLVWEEMPNARECLYRQKNFCLRSGNARCDAIITIHASSRGCR